MTAPEAVASPRPRSLQIQLDELFTFGIPLRRRTVSTAILRRIRFAAENAMAMVVLAFIGTRKMHGRREASLPRIVLSLNLGQPCRDARLDIAQLLLQLRLLRLSSRKEAFVELQRKFDG